LAGLEAISTAGRIDATITGHPPSYRPEDENTLPHEAALERNSCYATTTYAQPH
jgi:hypothetical protein